MAKHKLYIKKITKKKRKYILCLGDIRGKDMEIFKISNKLRENANPKDLLEIRIIGSAGGYSDHMHAIINIININFCFRTTTVNEYKAASAAASIFLNGDRRIVYSNSRIMLHSLSGEISGTIQAMDSELAALKASYYEFEKWSLRPYLRKKEIKQLFDGKEFNFTADEMCRRKIATHVMWHNRELLTAKKFLKK